MRRRVSKNRHRQNRPIKMQDSFSSVFFFLKETLLKQFDSVLVFEVFFKQFYPHWKMIHFSNLNFEKKLYFNLFRHPMLICN